MKINIVGVGVTIGDSLEAKSIKKLEKFNRFFNENADCQVKYSAVKEVARAELTIQDGKIYYRAEAKAEDSLVALDLAISRLERSIQKQKSRIKKRKKSFVGPRWDTLPPIEEDQNAGNITFARTKLIDAESMEPEDAVIKMELVGHDFFLFRNAKTGRMNVVYARDDGNYGLLETTSDV